VNVKPPSLHCAFLPRDARAKRGYDIACRPSVCDDQVP